MTHALTIWLGRFLFPSRPMLQGPLPDRQPMKIEVERLPDYRWQDLGFSPPQRQRPE